MAEADIQWPWQYSFPPFFTLQLHAETRSRQISAWKQLILDYCRTKKICYIDISEASRHPPFCNASIDRNLQPNVIVTILEELASSGYASPCDKAKRRWQIYWHTLPELANMVYNRIRDNGMTNTVCTFFELTQDDTTIGEDFHGLDSDVLVKALKVLEAEKKCELILYDDNQGVKFF